MYSVEVDGRRTKRETSAVVFKAQVRTINGFKESSSLQPSGRDRSPLMHWMHTQTTQKTPSAVVKANTMKRPPEM